MLLIKKEAWLEAFLKVNPMQFSE